MKTEKSKEALIEQINSGKLDGDKAKILHYIKTYKTATLQSLCSHFNKPIQTISARVSDLNKMGLIYVDDLKEGVKKTQYSVWVYEHDVNKQEERANAILLKRFEAWKKAGNEFKHLTKQI